ncbi:MAG: S9 family peptidase [Ignavibacteriaceae bacterium]|nr:S9 family peptidase [Ignavibacteriaceae bacterium]
MKKIFAILFLIPLFLFAQEKRAITYDDLWGMQRIGTFDVSPDGGTIAFSVSNYSMDLNKGNSDVYLINSDGSNLRPLKESEKSESSPKFSPDGKTVAYSLGGQIWTCNIDGSGDKQLTNIYTGASGFEWSNDGDKILFVSSVYPDCVSEECNKTRDDQKESSKVKASIFTELMYRHWDEWRGDKRSHLFLFEFKNNDFTDITLMSKFDVPPIALGSGNDYNFSPDGQEVAFTMNESEVLATSTNNDIFIIDLTDVKKGLPTSYNKISVSKGNDNQPVYSPDGNYIAFVSMERAGFEADKQNIILYNRADGSVKNITNNFNLSVGEFIWSNDSKEIYFVSSNTVNESIFNIDIETSKVSTLVEEHGNSSIALSQDGKALFFKQQRTNMPHEIFKLDLETNDITQITKLNEKRLAGLEMNSIETFWSKGAGGANVQSIIVKPPFFDPNKKYPMMFLIHGGPQGHWMDDFHFRWNMQMFAAPGYVVVAPNPRGSVGYGQKFTDEISGDWGGKPYEDLMSAYDYAVANFPFIDKNNTFAAGASYGGYMINWLATQTDRFNALVCHDGVFNLESMYGTTEELWFPEWENGGTPWQNRELYKKWSPHQFVQNIKTPILVIHGAQDFRVPEEQAFQLFTSLQRLGVESKFLYFPDETHFVTKPQNSRLWWQTVYDWFDKHYKR